MPVTVPGEDQRGPELQILTQAGRQQPRPAQRQVQRKESGSPGPLGQEA